MAKRIVGAILLAAALTGAGYFFLIAPAKVDADYNRVIAGPPTAISPDAAALHKTLRVADLHADTLLWMRDPLRRNARGHVDIPRLQEGGFRVQVFSAVTKTPKNMNFERNTGDSDNITLLAVAQRWPLPAWGSLAERALYQAARLRRAAAKSKGVLMLATNRDELAQALDKGAIAAILATEGAHPLEGDLANLERLRAAGYRVLGLQHFFDNELGGSLHGLSGAGLSEFGRNAVARALVDGMIIDVAHSSEAVVRDVLEISSRPLLVSHTGVRGHCDSPRNIPDSLLREIAEHGGLIGIGFWDGAVCATGAEAIAAAIESAVSLVGAEHVALGSDFDGTTTTPFDAAHIAILTDALLRRGMAPETIRLVMGENEIRFFLENLPEY